VVVVPAAAVAQHVAGEWYGILEFNVPLDTV